MMLLSADLSDPLLELLPRHPALVDAVEVGPWFSLAQVQAYRRALPSLPFYFHGADLLAQVGAGPAVLQQVAAYLDATGSPWVSMHLCLWPADALASLRRSRVRPPLPDVAEAARQLSWQVSRLAESISAPILLENVEPQPFAGCEFEVQAELITRFINSTGCGFLLDLGHALISASVLGMDIHAYLSALPLARVEQVHLSSTRLRDGRLFDAHQPLQLQDYALLEYVLACSHPQLVTLEYIRLPGPLLSQLARLRQILDSQQPAEGCP